MPNIRYLADYLDGGKIKYRKGRTYAASEETERHAALGYAEEVKPVKAEAAAKNAAAARKKADDAAQAARDAQAAYEKARDENADNVGVLEQAAGKALQDAEDLDAAARDLESAAEGADLCKPFE